MKNQVIEVLDEEHGKKVIEYWKNQGVDTQAFVGYRNLKENDKYRFYGVITGVFSNFSESHIKEFNAEIITLPEKKQFPRKMLVWNKEKCGQHREVICIDDKTGHCIAFCHGDETNYFEGDQYGIMAWRHCEEIPESESKPTKTPTIEELTERVAKLEEAIQGIKNNGGLLS